MAASTGPWGNPVTYRDELKEEPWHHDFFDALRRLERSNTDKPRIGESDSVEDEYVLVGQDPSADFPTSNICRVDEDSHGRLRVFVRFLGLLGPQGPMPLETTIEAQNWAQMRDDSFARFLDILNHRFLQLFFRSWANARPVAQHDRPHDDRFSDYVGSLIGIGTNPYKAKDSISDLAKLRYAGLLGPQVKSAARLRDFVSDLFGIDVAIEEFVGTWLELEDAECSRIGRGMSTLGTDVMLGSSAYSVQDIFRIRIITKDLDQFCSFLPSGDLCMPLADAVYFYLGEQLDYEVELALPAKSTSPVQLGQAGQLGWTCWMTVPDENDDAVRTDARFHPADWRPSLNQAG